MSAALLVATLLSVPQSFQSKAVVDTTPRYTFELRFTPYRPHISDDDVNERLFKQTFKKALNNALIERRPMMFGLELDRYFLTDFGLLGVAGRIGYWNVEGKTRVCGDPSAPSLCSAAEIAAGTSRPGNTDQSFTVVPLSFDLVYRMDQAYRDYGVPLVPYLKAGIDWHLWWIRVNGEVSETARGKDAEGGVWGWHGSAGLALNIDWLEPGAKRSKHGGVRGSFLFAEVTYVQGENFGLRPAVDMSDMAVLFGVSLDLD